MHLARVKGGRKRGGRRAARGGGARHVDDRARDEVGQGGERAGVLLRPGGLEDENLLLVGAHGGREVDEDSFSPFPPSSTTHTYLWYNELQLHGELNARKTWILYPLRRSLVLIQY